MGIPLLNEIVIILLLSVVILYVCNRIKIPAVVGFLITGILAGPHGLKLVSAVDQVEMLSQIGVVLLLFTVGLEFSFADLFQMKKPLLVGGSVQVFATIILAFLSDLIAGRSLNQSLFMGFLISLSSTAIVLKILQEKAQVNTPHGKKSLAILIFQDLIAIPMILFTPVLAGAKDNVFATSLVLLLKVAAIIFFVFVSAKWIVPKLLYRIVKTRSREIFMLSVVGICFAVAWLTSSLGLSLALGAFLAGLIISQSEYSHQALSNIFPFKDVFTSFFFISVGMLLDVRIFAASPFLIVSIVIAVILAKTAITGFAVVLLGFPLRTAILTGLALSQVGEFSFIISQAGLKLNLLDQTTYQIFLSVSILTMALTPFIMALSPKIADLLLKIPAPEKLKTGLRSMPEIKKAGLKGIFKNHLIIIGYGINGKNLARAAKLVGIQYLIIEMNPVTVRDEREKGEPIFYGDATEEAVLEHAGIGTAKVVVLAISDHAATRRITAYAKKLNPAVHVIARTVFMHEVKPLYKLGADEVIPEEFETSVEIFTRVLSKYLIPRDVIEKFVAEVRAGGYEMFRSLSKSSANLNDLKVHLSNTEITALKVGKGSNVIQKTLKEMELRSRYGVTIVAIQRGKDILSNPSADTKVLEDDVLIVLGSGENVALAGKYLEL